MNKRLKYGLFVFIFALLLLVSTIGLLTDSQPKTFYSLLVMFQEVPEVISMSDINNYFNLSGWIANLPDWLSWMSGFFNFLDSIITFLGFVLKGLIDTAVFIFYFVRWIFV